MQQLISNYRTMFLFRGIAAVLFGILALVWPRMTLTVLVFVFGVFAVISGITAMAAALRNTGDAGMGISPLRGYPGYPGWGDCPGMAGHHCSRFPLPACVLGDPDRHFGDRSPTLLPHERWARYIVGAGRIGIDHLRHTDCRPACIRAARCSLVDWYLRDRVWGHVHRGVLRITIPVS